MEHTVSERTMALARVAAIALCALAAVNALWFTADAAIALPSADAWHLIDTFVRKAAEGTLTFADFFAQRSAGDHAQPLNRLVLYAHLTLADLDFRVEALIGIAIAVATCTLLAWQVVRGAASNEARLRAWFGAVAIFAFGLSLNATNIYTWSLVGLGWILLFVATLYWICIAVPLRERAFAGVAVLATFAMASVLDELALPTFAAAVAALVVCDGWRNPRRAIVLAIAGGVGLALGRVLIHAMTSAPGAADATGGSFAQLLSTMLGPGAWKLVVVPLADSLFHQEHAVAWFGASAAKIQIVIALAIAALHVAFWWQVLIARRALPRRRVVVLAVAMMLFFYATILGIALSRVPEFGLDYLHQPRYVAIYQLNLLALVLLFASPRADADAAPANNAIGLAIFAFFGACLLLQVQHTRAAWALAPFVQSYERNATLQLQKLAADPLAPAPACSPILTVCKAAPGKRASILELMRTHHLNVYSDRFGEANGIESFAVARVAAPKPATPACATIQVLKYAPQRIAPGARFNVQPNGLSAFWMTVPKETPKFVVSFEGQPIHAARRDGAVTFYYDERMQAAVAAGRPLRLDFTCAGAPAGTLDVPADAP
jgi:hypothetical protein